MNRIALLLSKGQHEMTKPEGLVFVCFFLWGVFHFKEILQWQKSLQTYTFGEAERFRNCQGNCKNIKKSEIICFRVSVR